MKIVCPMVDELRNAGMIMWVDAYTWGITKDGLEAIGRAT
jgi:hypothetical protein